MKKITVCCHCKKGGESGPLIKISEQDYAHLECFSKSGVPKIANQSFIHVPDNKDIKEIMKQARESKVLKKAIEKEITK